MYQTSQDRGIVLGKKLAQNLGVKIGNKIVYTMMDKEGEIVAGYGDDSRASLVRAHPAWMPDCAYCLSTQSVRCWGMLLTRVPTWHCFSPTRARAQW